MAKKKPAGKMPATKKAGKPAKKKPAKTPPKKVVKMAKKAPAKKAPAKKAAPAKKSKSLVQKVVAKVKTMTKEQLKALQAKEKAAAQKEKERQAKERAKEKAAEEKERAREKALLAKERERELKEKAKQKEQEKKQKEKEKLNAKAAKEQEKLDAKKRKEDDKIRAKEEKERAKRIARGEEVEDEAPRRRGDDDEGEDEFLEYAKKSKGKSGKSKYDDDVQIDLFEGKSKKYKNAVMNELEGKIGDEIAELREHFNWKEIAEAIGTMDFFIDAKNDECVEKGCDNIRTTQSYCRLHYLRNWKVIQKKREILKEGKLQEYIEELISKYPPKYIEALLSDLSDDKEFYTVLNQLNITSEFDFEEDELVNVDDDDDDGDDIGIETISSSLRYEDE